MSALRKKPRPLRGLLFFQSHTLDQSHTRSAGRLRSSLARHACSALLLSSLTWGQDNPEPNIAAPVGREDAVAER